MTQNGPRNGIYRSGIETVGMGVGMIETIIETVIALCTYQCHAPPTTPRGYVGLGWGFDNFGGHFPCTSGRSTSLILVSSMQYRPLEFHIEAHTLVP